MLAKQQAAIEALAKKTNETSKQLDKSQERNRAMSSGSQQQWSGERWGSQGGQWDESSNRARKRQGWFDQVKMGGKK